MATLETKIRTETYIPNLDTIQGLTEEAIRGLYGQTRLKPIFGLNYTLSRLNRGNLQPAFDNVTSIAYGLSLEIELLTEEESFYKLRKAEAEHYGNLSRFLREIPYQRAFKPLCAQCYREQGKRDEENPVLICQTSRQKLIEESRRVGIVNYWAKVK